MLNLASSGMEIGMKITMISVHSSGQPSRKMMICARIMNWIGVRPSDSTHFSITSWPPSSAKAAEKIDDPTKSQHTIADVLAVRNTDSRTVGQRFTWRQARMHHPRKAAMLIQPTHSGGPKVSTSNLSSRNQITEIEKIAQSGSHVFITAPRRPLGSAYQR